MKILVTGASGTVGYATLKHLLDEQNHEITVFDLKTTRSKKLLNAFKDKINIVYGDIREPTNIAQACRHQEIIIHLAAIIPPLADDNPELAEAVNINGTRNLIQCVKQGSPGAFFIYGSSISVYGDRLKDPYIKVGDLLQASMGDAYALTKIAAEKLVQESGLKYTILRITAVMGVNNHKVSKIIFHMPLATPIELITPLDAGRAFARTIDHQQGLKNNIFNLSGGKNCQILYRDFIGQSFENYGLGALNFPEHSFASENFHCGYYADGDELEEILHFRSETIDDYFRHQISGVKPIIKLLTTLFRGMIKRALLAKSEPLRAIKEQDTASIKRFFGELD